MVLAKYQEVACIKKIYDIDSMVKVALRKYSKCMLLLCLKNLKKTKTFHVKIDLSKMPKVYSAEAKISRQSYCWLVSWPH